MKPTTTATAGTSGPGRCFLCDTLTTWRAPGEASVSLCDELPHSGLPPSCDRCRVGGSSSPRRTYAGRWTHPQAKSVAQSGNSSSLPRSGKYDGWEWTYGSSYKAEFIQPPGVVSIWLPCRTHPQCGVELAKSGLTYQYKSINKQKSQGQNLKLIFHPLDISWDSRRGQQSHPLLRGACRKLIVRRTQLPLVCQ